MKKLFKIISIILIQAVLTVEGVVFADGIFPESRHPACLSPSSNITRASFQGAFKKLIEKVDITAAGEVRYADGFLFSDVSLDTLLYLLDNPRVKEVFTEILSFGYGQFGISRDEVEQIINILQENKSDLVKARQAVYDAGFGWIQKGNRYHEIYKRYKAKVRYATTFDQIRGYIKEGDIIADIGCGDDKLGVAIVDNIAKTRVIGVDVVDYRNNRTDYKPHKDVDFKLQEAPDKVPLPDNSVDKVIFSAVLHHTKPEVARRLLSEAKRILKAGGEIIIIEDLVLESVLPVHNENDLVGRFKKLTEEERKGDIAVMDWYANHVVIGETKIPMGMNYKSEKEWEQTFAQAGFEIKERNFIGIYKNKFHMPPHAIFVLKKSGLDVNNVVELENSIIPVFSVMEKFIEQAV